LLAEKEAAGLDAVQSILDSMPEDAKRLWEAEKAELAKARDDTAAQLKVIILLFALHCFQLFQPGRTRASQERHGRGQEHTSFECTILV
jgi:hypothetical protein